jgi:hypothetical protein
MRPPVKLLAVCHPAFPLRPGKAIEGSALASNPLLLLDSAFGVRKLFDAVCRLANLKPKIVMERRAPSNLLDALDEAKHGVAVISSVVLIHRYKLRVLASLIKESRLESRFLLCRTNDVCFPAMRW